jgi:hypothetical protein
MQTARNKENDDDADSLDIPIPVSDTAGKAGETIVGFGNRLCAALRLLPVAA